MGLGASSLCGISCDLEVYGYTMHQATILRLQPLRRTRVPTEKNVDDMTRTIQPEGLSSLPAAAAAPGRLAHRGREPRLPLPAQAPPDARPPPQQTSPR